LMLRRHTLVDREGSGGQSQRRERVTRPGGR
jgi:hypothetical protein